MDRNWNSPRVPTCNSRGREPPIFSGKQKILARVFVKYGLNGLDNEADAVLQDGFFRARLTGLAPQAVYQFRIGSRVDGEIELNAVYDFDSAFEGGIRPLPRSAPPPLPIQKTN